MGSDIVSDAFVPSDHERFSERLREGLEALDAVLRRPGFGAGSASIGAELELCLIDSAARPLPLNQAILERTRSARVTAEVDRFNLEINTLPVALRGRPFAALETDMRATLHEVAAASAGLGGRAVMIGILPTFCESDLQSTALSDRPRYRALSAELRRLRDEPFRVRIDGTDPLDTHCPDVTFEGANTSLQVHLRVEPRSFASTFNAAQVAIGPVLAAAGNSPLFLGHQLWEETRIALFRQAVDERVAAAEEDWRPARVSFGHGWVRRGALELFAEGVALHTPLLPIVGSEDIAECVRTGGVPRLEELRLHHSTIWRWNRAVYDPTGGGHLRIEMRALPAGPSVPDMLANVALLVGLTLGLAPRAEWLVTALTFGQARRNFYAAARYGLAAEFLWPDATAPSPRPIRAVELLPKLMPVARAGLIDAGIQAEEADRLLEIIGTRVGRRQTGAVWQRRMLASLERGRSRESALAELVERYHACTRTDQAVHSWPIADG
jgi:gamma-glutamyl:cysteine ligase YbdK (ATP-grasp superfamily)